MLLLTVGLVPIMRYGLLISRLEGAFLLSSYGGILFWQIWQVIHQ
jgi:hypothetical protein